MWGVGVTVFGFNFLDLLRSGFRLRDWVYGCW